MRFRTDNTPSTTLKTEERPEPETAETTGDVELGCIFCHRKLPVKETVVFWNIEGRFIVAHPDCALPRPPGMRA